MDNNNGQNPYQPPQGFGYTPRITERSIATCIVLSIITCGIYMYYWLYCLNEDVRTLSGDRNGTTGDMVILFSIITCGIYLYYWFYKQGDAIDRLKMQRGGFSGSLGILYLILSIVGFSIVSYALMQNEINNLARGSF